MKTAHNYFTIGKKCYWTVIPAFWSKWAFFAINSRGWSLYFSAYPGETLQQARERITKSNTRDTLNESN
jgi:hypothetical protein